MFSTLTSLGRGVHLVVLGFGTCETEDGWGGNVLPESEAVDCFEQFVHGGTF